MKYSFFTRRGGSGQIRGNQMAEYLGGELNSKNPTGDVRIYVKMKPPEENPPRTYLDILDGKERIRWLKTHPEIGIIVASKSGVEHIWARLGRKSILIPQHHCNFDNELSHSPRRGRKVGVIGCSDAVSVDVPFHYTHKIDYKTRQDVVDFYKTVGIQVIWRKKRDRPLKNSLKIINAMSFGIPTIAKREVGYSDVEGYYIAVDSVQEMKYWVDKFKTDNELYNTWRQRGLRFAEDYHISKIAKLYEAL